jgi:hypothetical protein
MTSMLLRVRRALVPMLALVALLACAASAQADIRLQPVRSLDAREGSVVPRDRIVSFDDAGACAPGEYAIQVNWGDGTTSPGEITFTDQLIGIDLQPLRCIYEAAGAHVYRTAATAPLSVSVCRGAECRSSAGGSASVGEAPIAGELEGFGARAGRAFSERIARFRDDNELAQASDYTAVIDWGDGTTSAGSVTGERGRFEVAGGHAYAAAGARAVRVTLLQAGAERVAVGGTIEVAPAEDGSGAAAAPAPAATPDRIVANSARGARTTLRLGSRSLSRKALRRGLPVRLSVPASLRSLTIAVVGTTGRARTLGTVRLRLRGGTVAGGVRTVSTRVPLTAALRRKLRSGSYALRVRSAGGGLLTAGFRVGR